MMGRLLETHHPLDKKGSCYSCDRVSKQNAYAMKKTKVLLKIGTECKAGNVVACQYNQMKRNILWGEKAPQLE